MLELGEQCDDGNLLGGDGCSAVCTIEAGSSLLAINEIVTQQQSDWDDSSGGAGVPFDPTPGTGVEDTSDEYIEIKNFGPLSLFVNGLQITMTDGTNATYVIGAGGGPVEHYSAGGAGLLPPGAVLVIGNPTGTLNNDVFIELESVGGVFTINDVEVGDAGIAGDGAPAVGDNGASTSPADEAIRRIPGSFTGNDAVDFERGAGNPGADGGFALLAISEVVTAPQSDWSDSVAAGAPFDSTAGSGAVDVADEYVEIRNFGTGSLFVNGLRIQMTDAGTDTHVIGSGVGGVEHYSSGGAGFLPAGAALVIGNPPGNMANNVFVEIETAGGQTINDVEIGVVAGQAGDGAPAVGADGASTGVADESMRRLPGAFTGNDAVDFDAGTGDPGL